MSNPEKPKLAPVIHERPKMPARTWSALRGHIIGERRKKQEEEGKLEEEQRMKKEREHKKKQEANNLEETKEQITLLEEKLTSLKEEKHQLFLTLKKVLNEDDVRRRKESSEMAVLYPQHQAVFPLTGHVAPSSNSAISSRYMQPGQQSRQSLYMKPAGHGLPPVPPAQPLKRQRTPSPAPPPPVSLGQPVSYYQPSHLPTTHTLYGTPTPSYHYTPASTGVQTGGRDLLREAVTQGLGPGMGAREILQGMGARERELLGSLGQRERELLASMGGQGRDLLAGMGAVDRDMFTQGMTGGGREQLVSQAMAGGARDLLAQSMAGVTGAKEDDTYARYLASFQHQLEAAGSKTDLDRAKALAMQGEMERARLAMSLSQAQPVSLPLSLPRGVTSGYYTHAAQGSGGPSHEQGERGKAAAFQGGRYYMETGKKGER